MCQSSDPFGNLHNKQLTAHQLPMIASASICAYLSCCLPLSVSVSLSVSAFHAFHTLCLHSLSSRPLDDNTTLRKMILILAGGRFKPNAFAARAFVATGVEHIVGVGQL